MQRIPFQQGWAFAREPGLPVFEDDDSSITFSEPPASPDPSTGNTSVYVITPSVETPGPPTPPSADPHLQVGDLIRAAAARLQGAAPAAAVDAAPDAASEEPAAAQGAAATPPTTPLRRSARIAARARAEEEAHVVEEAPRPPPRRGPQRVAKMSTGGVRKY